MADCLVVCSTVAPLTSSYTRSSGWVGCRESSGLSKSWQAQRLVLIRHKRYRRLVKKVNRRGIRVELGNSNGKNEPSSMSEDLQYFGKFLTACTAGAVLIKYGCILLPSITQPNLLQALFMISTPVLVSVAVLLAASSEQK